MKRLNLSWGWKKTGSKRNALFPEGNYEEFKK